MCVTEIFEWIFCWNISVLHIKTFRGSLTKCLLISRQELVLTQEVGLEELTDLETAKSLRMLFAEI